MSQIDVLSRTQKITVLSRTQRIIVAPNKTVRVYPAGTIVSVENAGPQGVPGLPGIQGPQGPQGIPGDESIHSYTHSQGTPSELWIINHGLGFHPNVTVVDSGGTEVTGIVRYVDLNTIEVTFTLPFGGTAYLS